VGIAKGGHVSIGLGDDPYTNLGLPTNADLVRVVADLADKHGRPVASPAEARDLLHFT
jgi:3-keto-5-aminohexanoate cleavage enzyme